MDYEGLQKHIVNLLKTNNNWQNAVSIDIEADLRILDDPKNQLLSISAARRVDNKIEINNFIVDDETPEEEARILSEFGTFCWQTKPLVLIGYNIARFDFPIISLKMRQLENSFKADGRYQPGYWALRDVLTKGYVLDAMDPVRYEIAKSDNSRPKIVSLEVAMSHPRFKNLSFKKTKYIVSSMEGPNKWEIIRNLWKNDRKSFEKYIEGDVHDTMLIVENIFEIK